MRLTVDGAYPVACAIERVLHWVASRGFSSSVLRTTSATASSSMRRGRPERGSSSSPSRRCSAKRLRHFLAVWLVTPSTLPICTLVSPSAASSTMCARSDRPRQTLRTRASRSSSLRSSALSLISTEGRITMPPESTPLLEQYELCVQDTIPAPAPDPSSYRLRPKAVELVFNGQHYPARNASDVLIQVFRALTKHDPSFPERFAHLPRHGRTRRYLARDRDDLYPGRQDLAREYSKQLKGLIPLSPV